MADFVVTENANFDIAQRIGRAARIGIVGEPILRAKLAVDLIEDDAKFSGIVREEHCAAGRFRNGLKRVLAGGVATVFVLNGANQDCIEQSVGANGSFAGGVKVGAAGGFAAVGYENDNVASLALLRS